ncbi:MAG: PfkB family carbohydrate kinase, partial [Solirubrobacteraceae bacterium]
LQARGAGGVVVRVGAEGAWVAAPGAPAELVAPPRDEQVIDEIGAGDAFAAGFTYGLLGGRAPAECVRLAHTLAATALRGTGDWETLPRLAEFSPGPGGRPAGR